MTAERRNLIIAMVVLGAGVLIQLYAGILAGLREDWMRMNLSFFTCTFLVFAGVMAFVVMRLKDHLVRVEEHLQISHKQIPPCVCRITTVVGIFMVLSTAIHMTLAVIVGFRGYWFRLGIHLTACAITVIVCMAILAMVALNAHLARLEQLPAGTRKAEGA